MAINPTGQSVFDQIGLTKQTQTKSSDTLGQSDFLKLMTTQLNNQDPMKPMEGGEFFSQISQFSSVAGIEELNKTFTKVADSMFSGQALQASSLVGRTVMVESSSGKLVQGASIEGSVSLPSSADGLHLSILKPSGEVVKSIDLGAQQRGTAEFNWDGTLSDGSMASPGTYIVKADARFGRETFAQETWIKERIDSVTLGDGLKGIKLNMSSDNEITLNQVKKIL